MEILGVENLTFTYPEGRSPALRDLTLSVQEGDFLVLCGYSGCGKSTLLRQFQPQLAPHGQRSGRVLFQGAPLARLSLRESASLIGFVMQSPENQIVTDKVWHELAFGLESLGLDTPTIRRRVAEMASFFGMQNWFYQSTAELSGGQKQLLNLASVMVMHPKVLLLDEPTAQLDPIAASDFLMTLHRINRELGTTVVLADHRLEEALPLANRAAVMDSGSLLTVGTPSEVGAVLRRTGHGMFLAMPAAMQIWGASTSDTPCPVSTAEGRTFLRKYLQTHPAETLPDTPIPPLHGEAVVRAEEVWFRYEKDAPDILKGFSVTAHAGEMLCVLGGNGTGKTTALRVLSGFCKPYRGRLTVSGRVSLLPQNPQSLFVKKTVREDLADVLKGKKWPKAKAEARIEEMLALCRLTPCAAQHPYDLSGGEQQRAALAKVLLTDPDILLLDEPTKGMDARFKQTFAAILKALLRAGVCIVMVSHDVEFCARYADRCLLFFDGSGVCEEPPRAFFSGNRFYTTGAAHIAEGILPGVVTTEDAVRAMGGTMPAFMTALATDEAVQADPVYSREAKAAAPDDAPSSGAAKPPAKHSAASVRLSESAAHAGDASANSPAAPGRDIKTSAKSPAASERDIETSAKSVESPANARSTLPLWRRVGAAVSALAALFVMFYAARNENLGEMVGQEGMTAAGWHQLAVYGLFLFFLILAAVFLSRRESPGGSLRTPKEKRRLPKRTLASVACILLAVPLTLFIGVMYLDQKQYYITALAVVVECMLPFFMVFEGRRPKARELVIIAALCALSVAGRAAFFMLPQFKPVLAMTILSGVAFGGETGFLVGAVTMLVSNMLFSQGPWTPWQMFAMGIIGFLAGILYRKGLLRRSRLSLCAFGAVCAILLYGGIMNFSSALIWAGSALNWDILLSYYVTGFPMDCVHAVATVLFLWFLTEPLLEKLDRIKVKYGLVE